jgi:hypothetical protein
MVFTSNVEIVQSGVGTGVVEADRPTGRHRRTWQDQTPLRGQSAPRLHGSGHRGSLSAALLSPASPASRVPVELKLPPPQKSDPMHGMPGWRQVPAIAACSLMTSRRRGS